jgi:hypothetical protein
VSPVLFPQIVSVACVFAFYPHVLLEVSTLKIPSVAAVSLELCSVRVCINIKPLLQNYFIPVFDVLCFFSSGSLNYFLI